MRNVPLLPGGSIYLFSSPKVISSSTMMPWFLVKNLFLLYIKKNVSQVHFAYIFVLYHGKYIIFNAVNFPIAANEVIVFVIP